jgi:hypothetical protein
VEFGSNGIVVAVLLPVMKSATFVSLPYAFDCISDIFASLDVQIKDGCLLYTST